MAHFISVLISQENDSNKWVYAQEADSLSTLESNPNYFSIKHMPKHLFNGVRANNKIRNIKDNFGQGTIQVVSYKGNIKTSDALLAMSATLSKKAMKNITATFKDSNNIIETK